MPKGDPKNPKKRDKKDKKGSREQYGVADTIDFESLDQRRARHSTYQPRQPLNEDPWMDTMRSRRRAMTLSPHASSTDVDTDEKRALRELVNDKAMSIEQQMQELRNLKLTRTKSADHAGEFEHEPLPLRRSGYFNQSQLWSSSQRPPSTQQTRFIELEQEEDVDRTVMKGHQSSVQPHDQADRPNPKKQ